MRRFTVSLSLAVVVLLGLIVSGFRTQAQDATPEAMTSMMATATHPVVGIWRTTVTNQGDDPFSSLTTFHGDGTYTEVLPDGLVLTGLWQPTGERTAAVTGYLNYFIGDQLVEGAVNFTAEVDETGNTVMEAGNFIGFYQDGSVAIAVDSPATGTRLEVRPVEPLGTPVFPPEMTEEATPAP
jgi:hypothetical protein